ncbi:MAG: hypothetical protein PHC51_09965 [bacterium]|nr:hypothetical protein [bacterium]
MKIREMVRSDYVAGIGFRQGTDDIPRVQFVVSGEKRQDVLRIARRFGIPLKKDPLLADYLSVKIEGSPVDPFIYKRVARLLLDLQSS